MRGTRSIGARGLALLLAVVVASAPACKSKKDAPAGDTTGTSSGGGGKGRSDEGGSAAPPVTPTGPVVNGQGASIALPTGADPTKITVTVRPPADVPAPVQPYKARLDDVYQTLAYVELGPDGTQLAAPGIVTVTVDPSKLPAGRTMADVVATSVASDGTVEDLQIVGVHGNDVQVEVHHFSFLVLGMAVGAIIALGTMALIMRGATEPVVRVDCAKWLAPQDPTVQALAGDPSKFAIDTKTGDVTLDIGKPLRGKNVDQGSHALRVDQIIDKGEGDCVNMSTLFGSLLLAKGYPVRTVAGTATYDRGGKTYKGLHQWTETVIDGKGYYVDAFDPAHTRLLPLADATSELRLERNRMCGKNPDGTTIGPDPYDGKWVEAFSNDPLAEKKKLLQKLIQEHRDLDAACRNNKAGACSDRQSKYEEAKKLQEEINAAEQPH